MTIAVYWYVKQPKKQNKQKQTAGVDYFRTFTVLLFLLSDSGTYYLLSDVLPEDKELRQFLQKRKLVGHWDVPHTNIGPNMDPSFYRKESWSV